ncbi:MAG: hypothetical protein IT576_12110 [Verrucomicrobiales bacterium]|nr:hypothetical protein [Verrucomicrobiales bacterium]
MANTDVYTGYHKTSFADLGTGRVLHPLAYLILLLIGFAFLRDDNLNSPRFATFGWWASLLLAPVRAVPDWRALQPKTFYGGR